MVRVWVRVRVRDVTVVCALMVLTLCHIPFDLVAGLTAFIISSVLVVAG